MTLDEDILNTALEMAMEWGPTLGKPINDQLRERFPALSPEDAEAYNRLTREIVEFSFDQIEAAYTHDITDIEAYGKIKAKYPLLSDDSRARLSSQGQYYAWRNNG